MNHKLVRSFADCRLLMHYLLMSSIRVHWCVSPKLTFALVLTTRPADVTSFVSMGVYTGNSKLVKIVPHRSQIYTSLSCNYRITDKCLAII